MRALPWLLGASDQGIPAGHQHANAYSDSGHKGPTAAVDNPQPRAKHQEEGEPCADELSSIFRAGGDSPFTYIYAKKHASFSNIITHHTHSSPLRLWPHMSADFHMALASLSSSLKAFPFSRGGGLARRWVRRRLAFNNNQPFSRAARTQLRLCFWPKETQVCGLLREDSGLKRAPKRARRVSDRGDPFCG